jgi:hypothetical protein
VCREWDSQTQQQGNLGCLVIKCPELVKSRSTLRDSKNQQQGKMRNITFQFSEPMKILQHRLIMDLQLQQRGRLVNLKTVFRTHEVCREWDSQTQQQGDLGCLVIKCPELVKSRSTLRDSKNQQQGKMRNITIQFSKPMKILRYGSHRYSRKVRWEIL